MLQQALQKSKLIVKEYHKMYFRKTLEDLVQKLSNYLYPKKVNAKDDITVQRYFKVRSTNFNLGEAFRVNKIYGTLKPKS